MGLAETGRKAFRICPIGNQMERAQEAQLYPVSLQSPVKITQWASQRAGEILWGYESILKHRVKGNCGVEQREGKCT